MFDRAGCSARSVDRYRCRVVAERLAVLPAAVAAAATEFDAAARLEPANHVAGSARWIDPADDAAVPGSEPVAELPAAGGSGPAEPVDGGPDPAGAVGPTPAAEPAVHGETLAAVVLAVAAVADELRAAVQLADELPLAELVAAAATVRSAALLPDRDFEAFATLVAPVSFHRPGRDFAEPMLPKSCQEALLPTTTRMSICFSNICFS